MTTLLVSLLVTVPAYAGFCDWASSERVFQIENALADGARYRGDELVRADNLTGIRQNYRANGITDDGPQPIVGRDGATTMQASSISSENAKALFQHPLEGNVTGAKAIVYKDASTGELRSLFWRTYENGKPNQIHHRDAVAAVLERRQNNLRREAAFSQNRGFQNFALRQADLLRENSVRIGGTSSIRRGEAFPTSILDEMQGFQLSSKTVNGSSRVVKFEVSSSLTAAQARRTAETAEFRVDPRRLADRILTLHNSIDPAVRGYHTIEIERGLWDTLQRQGDLEKLRTIIRDEMKLKSGYADISALSP